MDDKLKARYDAGVERLRAKLNSESASNTDLVKERDEAEARAIAAEQAYEKLLGQWADFLDEAIPPVPVETAAADHAEAAA